MDFDNTIAILISTQTLNNLHEVPGQQVVLFQNTERGTTLNFSPQNLQ